MAILLTEDGFLLTQEEASYIFLDFDGVSSVLLVSCGPVSVTADSFVTARITITPKTYVPKYGKTIRFISILDTLMRR